MRTLTYNSANLSTKDRLTITNLLGLFEGRLNAKWVSVTAAHTKPADLVLIDVDQPQGLQMWEASGRPHGHVAVTIDDRWPQEPYITRPIRAFGLNGVVVLFNSIAQSLESPSRGSGIAPVREPARMRMTARLDIPSVPVSVIRPPAPAAQPSPAASRLVLRPAAPPPTSAPQPAAETPVRARVTVRWGPPEPVVLPPLTRMPGARIHQFGAAAPRHDFLEIPLPQPSIFSPAAVGQGSPAPAEPALPAKSWTLAELDPLPALENMPIVHRPVEIHLPSAPIIGRARLETYAPVVVRQEALADDVPFLRPAPPQWKTPEPEAVPQLMDFQALQSEPVVSQPPAQPEPPIAVEPELITEPHSQEELPSQATGVAAPAFEVAPLEVAAVEPEPVFELAPPEPLEVPVVPVSAVEVAEESEIQALLADVQEDLGGENLGILSQALSSEAYADDLPGIEAEADWWGTADLEAEGVSDAAPATTDESALLTALKAIKASAQPSILDIAGLPAVCVIPARNIYFTTAPAARLETAIGAGSDVTWRICATEAEARQASGTELARQSSLEQLSWTASLMSPPSDPLSLADHAVRLRRWPPITESRGRSKFLRYATLLSGAQATPRELSEITGDSVEEIVCFVNACSRMNLLENSVQARTPAALTPARSGGAGILRGMIEQLAPPKI